MGFNDKSLPHYILKLKDNAKEEKRQRDILKPFLKQIKSAYNEDLVQYNNISSNIILEEEAFETLSKQINKIKIKLYQIQLSITDEFLLSLTESMKSLSTETNKLLLLCFGYPDNIDSSVQLPLSKVKELIEILKHAKTSLKHLSLTNNQSFNYLKDQISRLKARNNALGFQVNQIINYISLIQNKISIVNDKAALLSKHQVLNKEKDNYYISLKQKEREINQKYGLYKLKTDYIRRIGNLLKEYKEYELLGNNYSLYNEMTAKIILLINTKVDSIDDCNNNNNLCIQNRYEDSLSESVSCSFLNDYSVNQDLLQRQDNRIVSNGNDIISLSPICGKDAKNSFYNSSLNKKNKNFFYHKPNGNNNDNDNIQQDKTNSVNNLELSGQINQMIDDTSRYDKQVRTNNIVKSIINHSIQNINSNYKATSDIQIVRGKQNKNANYSLKLEQPVNSGGCCISCT